MLRKLPLKLLILFQVVAILFGCVMVDDDHDDHDHGPTTTTTTTTTVETRVEDPEEHCYEHVCDGWSSGLQCFSNYDAYCDALCAEWGCGAEEACDTECGGW